MVNASLTPNLRAANHCHDFDARLLVLGGESYRDGGKTKNPTLANLSAGPVNGSISSAPYCAERVDELVVDVPGELEGEVGRLGLGVHDGRPSQRLPDRGRVQSSDLVRKRELSSEPGPVQTAPGERRASFTSTLAPVSIRLERATRENVNGSS